MTDTFKTRYDDPRTFWERLSRICGEGTYRMPVEAPSARSTPQIPAAHMLTQALSYARQGADDVGPDIAFDMVCQSTTYAGRVVRTVATAMCQDRARAVRRCRPWMRIVVWAAYATVVHGMRQDQLRPSEMATQDWDLLTEAAERILLSLAEQAVTRAERAYFARAA